MKKTRKTKLRTTNLFFWLTTGKKTVFIIILILISFIILYTLGFSTHIAYGTKDLSLTDEVPIYNKLVQPFNHGLFIFCIILFGLLIFNIIILSHKKKKYRVSNNVSVIAISVGLTAFSVYNLINLVTLLPKYNVLLNDPIQFAELKRLSEQAGLSTSRFPFYAGFVLSVLAIVTAIALIFFIMRNNKEAIKYENFRNEVLANETVE